MINGSTFKMERLWIHNTYADRIMIDGSSFKIERLWIHIVCSSGTMSLKTFCKFFIFLADSDNDQESAAGVQKNSPRQLAGRRLSSFNLFTFIADKDRGSKLSLFCIKEQQSLAVINYLGDERLSW